jgi:NADH:ubiquinone oxidoreductase subunit 6 (subunit J)
MLALHWDCFLILFVGVQNMDKSHSTSVRDAVLGYGSLIVWGICYIGALILLRKFQLEGWVRVAVALLPIPPFVLFLAMVLKEIRSLDELWRRIHLEALAIAFPLAVLLLMILGLMELATGLSPDDWSYRHVWVFMPIFYVIGVLVSIRRYK